MVAGEEGSTKTAAVGESIVGVGAGRAWHPTDGRVGSSWKSWSLKKQMDLAAEADTAVEREGEEAGMTWLISRFFA